MWHTEARIIPPLNFKFGYLEILNLKSTVVSCSGIVNKRGGQMWLRVLTIMLFLAAPLAADDKNIDFDTEADFTKFRTFSIRNGLITAQKPELRGPLVQNKIETALREQLKAKGLTETQAAPDLVVNYRLGASDRREVQRLPAGRRGRLTRLDTYSGCGKYVNTLSWGGVARSAGVVLVKD
jgi:hypothetical protein